MFNLFLLRSGDGVTGCRQLGHPMTYMTPRGGISVPLLFGYRSKLVNHPVCRAALGAATYLPLCGPGDLKG